MSWNDNVLLKLKRRYSKDETVAALIKKLSDTEILLGMRNDEISELKEKVQTPKFFKVTKEKIKLELGNKYENQIKIIQDENKEIIGCLQEQIENLEEENNTLMFGENEGSFIGLKQEHELCLRRINQYSKLTGIEPKDVLKTVNESVSNI